jgi:hypothetical protein
MTSAGPNPLHATGGGIYSETMLVTVERVNKLGTQDLAMPWNRFALYRDALREAVDSQLVYGVDWSSRQSRIA